MNRWGVACMILLPAMSISGCGDDDTSGDAATTISSAAEVTTSTIPAADPMFRQLCRVLDAARAGEIDVVRSTFDHRPLHTLADDTTAIDRSVAARLLEAKAAVESDLADPVADGPRLTPDLEALVDATAAALVTTGTPVAPTCEPESS